MLRKTLDAARNGKHLELLHSGLPDEESRDGHEAAWPQALEILDKALSP